MDNVYLDKVPTCCDECPCCNCDIDYGESCNLGAFNHYEDYQTIYKHPKCPLKSTSQLLAEERKKWVQEVKQKLCRIEDTLINLGNGKEDALSYFVDILDQIERGDDSNVATKNN